MSQHERRPGRRDVDELLVMALAAGATQEQAAERAGCSRATMDRRMTNPSFRMRVHAERDSLLAEATGQVVARMTSAAVTLGTLLGSEDDRTKLAAARALLDAGVKLRECTDIAERLARLEGELGAE